MWEMTVRGKLALVFAVLKFRQLSNNEQEVDDGEVRQALCGDVDLFKTNRRNKSQTILENRVWI